MGIIKRFATENYVENTIQTECYRSNVGGTGRFAKGIMNDCKIYNYALSDEEVQELLLY